ncbi:YjcZ family sporulation protein [Bacillus sp. V59.32b]|uniref:YjcZ family sporulation protein n=1 Tax=Bacillus sp. V59.32b TaxID=1758642 RepID=UPI0026BDCC0E
MDFLYDLDNSSYTSASDKHTLHYPCFKEVYCSMGEGGIDSGFLLIIVLFILLIIIGIICFATL